MGAGKSTLARTFQSLIGFGNSVIVSADYFFIGREWRREDLPEAHDKCKREFVKALAEGVPLVMVDNTNQTMRDYSFYQDEAKEYGYSVVQLVVENRHGGQPTKPVPEHIVERARARIRGDLVL